MSQFALVFCFSFFGFGFFGGVLVFSVLVLVLERGSLMSLFSYF